MTDQDYIRKAVELADGWEWIENYNGPDPAVRIVTPEVESWPGYWTTRPTTLIIDALAAQLVRQVDALERIYIDVAQGCVDIKAFDEWVELEWMKSAGGPDRTMNTIKAIVDSKILE